MTYNLHLKMRMWQVMDMEILHNDILQERSWVVYSLIPRVGGTVFQVQNGNP